VDTILGIVQSPIFLGLLLVLGFMSVIRFIVARDPSLKRIYGDDRRCAKTRSFSFPLKDSAGVSITRERRMNLDRRRSPLNWSPERIEY